MEGSKEDSTQNSMEYLMARALKNKLAIIVNDQDGTTQYCCVECPAKYLDKEKLELHLCMHNKEFRFLCGICGTGLKRKEHLDRHMLGHQEIRPHVCPECGKAFKRKEHLNIHRTIHSGEKNQVCTLCDRSFYRKDHLQKHLQTHTNFFLEQNMIQVSDQDANDVKQEFVDVEDLKHEIMTEDVSSQDSQDQQLLTPEVEIIKLDPIIEMNEERPYGCFVCGKTYKRKDHLKLHSLTHLKKKHVCSECGKAFHAADLLLNHMATHHQSNLIMDVDNVNQNYLPEEGEPIVYDEPPTWNNDLLVPIAATEYKSDRPHQCPICFRKFKRKQHLRVHSNIHLKEQPTLWCPGCGGGFQSQYAYDHHQCLSTEHAENGESPGEEQTSSTYDAKKENSYPQQFVEVTDSRASSEQNEETDASEINIPVPMRVFVCKFCSKPFKRKDHYKIHLNIHTGVRSFFCPDCGKGFYRKDHLQKHSLVHARISKPKTKKEMPDLFPINRLQKINGTIPSDIKPEITIHAPSNSKLRVPLKIKVPYQVVMEMDNGEQRAVTIDPQSGTDMQEILS